MRCEISFPGSSNQEIVEALFANSFVLLKSFVDRETLAEMRELLPAEGSSEDAMLIAKVGNRNLDDWVFGSRHRELLADIAAGFPVVRIGGMCIRRMRAPSAPMATKSNPIAPHIDGIFTGMGFVANFWIPLQDCGQDAPSLSVFDLSFDEVCEFLGCDKDLATDRAPGGIDTSHFRPEIHQIFTGVKGDATDQFRRDFRDRIWHPPFQAGDCMLITNWTIHETYSAAGMTKPRDAMELRFRIGESLATMLEAHNLPA